MKTNKTMLFVSGFMLLFTVAAASAADECKKFKFKDVHANKTATETDTYAINNKGVIAGDYVDAKNVQHGMILDGKKLTSVDKKNCFSTGGLFPQSINFDGINSAGTAVGFCLNSKTNRYEAFYYARSKGKGKFTPIRFPKSTGTQAYSINDKGDVVGLYFDSDGAQHGFKKIGNKYTSIDVKGGTNTQAWGINNKGWITLDTTSSEGVLAGYLLQGKKLTPIIDPNDGSGGNNVHQVNNNGDIVGHYIASTYDAGFLWIYKTKQFCDIKDPKAKNVSTRADGLNDKLEIVGRYSPPSGANVGFKATTKKQ